MVSGRGGWFGRRRARPFLGLAPPLIEIPLTVPSSFRFVPSILFLKRKLRCAAGALPTLGYFSPAPTAGTETEMGVRQPRTFGIRHGARCAMGHAVLSEQTDPPAETRSSTQEAKTAALSLCSIIGALLSWLGLGEVTSLSTPLTRNDPI